MGRVAWVRDRLHPLWAAWLAVQVEFQGRYSVERLQQLKAYSERLSNTRVLLICCLMPLPCLLIAILIEAIPLASPEGDVKSNWVFLLRFGIITCIMSGSMVYQMGLYVQQLTVKLRHIATIGLLSGVGASLTVYAVAATTVFPVPFSMLLGSPPSVLVFGVCFAIFWGAQFKADPSIKVEMDQQMTVLNCQLTLTLIYPLYIFGFTSFDGIYQTAFVLVLPFIKLVAKNWISHALGEKNDVKPESVVFNVEVFNALYISAALQNASSWISTATIMAVDLLQFWLSMLDVIEVLDGVKVLMDKIPRTHPIAKENFMQVALRLMAIETEFMTQEKNHSDTSSSEWAKRIDTWVGSTSETGFIKASAAERAANPVSERDQGFHGNILSHARTSSNKTNMFPIRPPKLRSWFETKVSPVTRSSIVVELKAVMRAGDSLGLETIFSRTERAMFIQKSARVLFIAEYLVLVEYVEVVLPIVYSNVLLQMISPLRTLGLTTVILSLLGLHRVILFNLHNCAYYPTLANLSSAQLSSSTLNVLVYGSLEFASLIASIIVLKRTLGFSSVRQLAFVLETQVGIIQGKVMILFIYIMQISLVHLGADFSFKFAWLHSISS